MLLSPSPAPPLSPRNTAEPRPPARRLLLRGFGGAVVALPALELLASRSARAAGPRRFLLAYGGTSLGGDGSSANNVIPTVAGPDYDVTRGLAPILTANVKKDVGVVSGLKVPWAAVGTTAPPGARPLGSFHGSTSIPQVTGLRYGKPDTPATGPSADQLAADLLAPGATQRLLTFRVQPVSYSGGNGGGRARLSWGKGGAATDPIVSPRLAYQSLFSALKAPTGAGDPPLPVDLNLARRRSVLDLVRGDTERLLPRLAKGDRVRLARHFDELRDLEKRIAVVDGSAGPRGAGCMKPPEPMADPPIGGNHKVTNDSLMFTEGAGYSNEELRAQVLVDMIAMAFACDIARAVSLMFTMSQCFMSMDPIGGQKSDMHQLGHGAGTARDVADGVAFHVKHFARLVAKLRDVADADGKPVLDSTAMVLLFEGGHGYDPDGNRMISSHSTERMIAVFAGRAGGLKPGQHVVATDRHPAEVVLTALRAVGHAGPLGDMTSTIPGLT